MMPGSVIVDMGASDLGSNCALTEPGKVITTENGVIIIGYTDLPARLPGQASQLFGQNIVNLLKLVTPDKNGQPVWNEDDVVIRGMLTTREGQIMCAASAGASFSGAFAWRGNGKGYAAW